jgi:hypothetical protein
MIVKEQVSRSMIEDSIKKLQQATTELQAVIGQHG